MFLGLSMINLNAEDVLVADEITIELAAGFTIEDIIQDLHDNANIIDITTYGSNSIYTIKYNPKVVDKTALVTYLDGHKGIIKITVD